MVRTYQGGTQEARLLIVVAIGILLLALLFFYKPRRTLVVTYQRGAGVGD